MAARRSASEELVFALTQSGAADSLTYQIARKQAYLAQLQSELRLLESASSRQCGDLASPQWHTLVSSL